MALRTSKGFRPAVLALSRWVTASLAELSALPADEATARVNAKAIELIYTTTYNKAYYTNRARQRVADGFCRRCPAEIDRGAHCEACRAKISIERKRRMLARDRLARSTNGSAK